MKLKNSPVSKILFINSVPHIGGAEATLVDLARNINKSAFRVHLVTTMDGSLAQSFRSLGCEIDYLDFPFFSRRKPWVYWRAISNLLNVIKRESIDLVHVNCDRAVPHSVVAGKLSGIPIISYIHDMVRAWYLPRYVWYLNRCSRIIADSQAVARLCVSKGMDRKKIQVIYETFNSSMYGNILDSDRRRLREQWGCFDEKIAVGIVGHLIQYKGHEDFLEAAVRIIEKNKSVKFIIVGDDSTNVDKSFFPKLLEFVKLNSLEDSVIFLGHREDIPQIMSALDILVVPSWTEAFGRVVVEALASGTPVIATNVGGIPEIITDGENGLLISPHDAEGLSKALELLIQNQDFRMRISQAGPVTARKFDASTHAKLFEWTYRSILDPDVDLPPLTPFGKPTWTNNYE